MAFIKSEFDALIQDCRDRAARKNYFFWILLTCIVGVGLYCIGGLILSPSFVRLANLELILVWLVAFTGLVMYMKLSQSRRRMKQELSRIDRIIENRHLWGEEISRSLLLRKVEHDMTPEMVLLSWGKPKRIENPDITKTKVSEETWIYSSIFSRYIQFINGKVSVVNGMP